MLGTSRTPKGAVNATITRNALAPHRIERLAAPRLRVAWALASALALSACAPSPPLPEAPVAPAATRELAPPPAPAQPRSRVVVPLVVDQLAGWIAEERWPELS